MANSNCCSASSARRSITLASVIIGAIILLLAGVLVAVQSPHRETSAAAATALGSTANLHHSNQIDASLADSRPSIHTADPEAGEILYESTCATCHGPDGRGLPHQGIDLRTSKFIAQRSDAQLVGFLRTGRQPKDPDTVRGLYMPARGGNMGLDDARLADIVAHLRTLQQPASPQSAGDSR